MVLEFLELEYSIDNMVLKFKEHEYYQHKTWALNLEFKVAFLIKKNSNSTIAMVANSSGTQVPWETQVWGTQVPK